MNGPLSAPRKAAATPYSKSPSLYGGDVQIDQELDQYFAVAGKKRSAARKNKAALSSSSSSSSSSKSSSNKRSHSSLSFASSFASSLEEAEDVEVVAEPVVGTATEVEKDYYRLTSAPVSSAVRPLPVLVAALKRVKERWKAAHDYPQCCNQLKSIRQDLTVQHIRDKFSCDVYETHGRIALEAGDIPEFAQLLTPLTSLYHDHQLMTSYAARAEFSAYRILLACHHHRESDLSLLSFITALPSLLSSHAYVQHALQVRQALLSHSYLTFFRLYLSAPCMSSYLLDERAAQVRMRGLRVVCTAYRPRVEVRWLAAALGMEDDDCVQWLVAMGMVLQEEGGTGGRPGGGYTLDCKHGQLVIGSFDDRGQRLELNSR